MGVSTISVAQIPTLRDLFFHQRDKDLRHQLELRIINQLQAQIHHNTQPRRHHQVNIDKPFVSFVRCYYELSSKFQGSSTPGPQQNVGNAGFPPPNNNAGPPFQGGPNAGGPQMSFGSPSGASTPFGRPGKPIFLSC